MDSHVPAPTQPLQISEPLLILYLSVTRAVTLHSSHRRTYSVHHYDLMLPQIPETRSIPRRTYLARKGPGCHSLCPRRGLGFTWSPRRGRFISISRAGAALATWALDIGGVYSVMHAYKSIAWVFDLGGDLTTPEDTMCFRTSAQASQRTEATLTGDKTGRRARHLSPNT